LAKKNQDKSTTGTAESNVENVVGLWADFSNQMESKIRDLFETSAAEYRDIYKSWTELSDKMGKQMFSGTLGDEAIYKNLYNSWKEYSERLNTDIGKITKSDDKSYLEFLDYWSKYSEKFSEQLSDYMREGLKEQYELYELWMDTFAKSALEGSKSGDIPSIFSKYWLDVFNRFSDFYSKGEQLSIGKGEYTKPGEGVYKQYEEMHNYWLNTSQKVLDEVMRSPAYGNFLAQAINSSMDSRKMMENITMQNLKSLGIPTKTELEEIRWELKNISTQLDELNQTIREIKKKK